MRLLSKWTAGGGLAAAAVVLVPLGPSSLRRGPGGRSPGEKTTFHGCFPGQLGRVLLVDRLLLRPQGVGPLPPHCFVGRAQVADQLSLGAVPHIPPGPQKRHLAQPGAPPVSRRKASGPMKYGSNAAKARGHPGYR